MKSKSLTMNRRAMIGFAAGSTILWAAGGAGAAEAGDSSDAWGKIFEENSAVSRRRVSFPNRYGITLAGDLYTSGLQDKGR